MVRHTWSVLEAHGDSGSTELLDFWRWEGGGKAEKQGRAFLMEMLKPKFKGSRVLIGSMWPEQEVHTWGVAKPEAGKDQMERALETSTEDLGLHRAAGTGHHVDGKLERDNRAVP